MKHYLQCDHCGHFNFVKSEYLIFCEKCDKKLTNNFKDWHKKFPDETLDDFKAQKCVSEEALLQMQSVEKTRKKKLSKVQWFGIIVGAIAAVGGSYLGSGFADKVKDKLNIFRMNQTEFVAADTTNWVDIFVADAGFEASFPRQPKDTTQVVDSEIGPLTMKMQLYEPEFGKDENLYYCSCCTVYPADVIDGTSLTPEQLDTFFKNSINGSVTNVKGKLLSVEEIRYKGYPGRESKIEVKNGLAIVSMRTYLVHNRMYMLEVISPVKNVSSKSGRKFFNSFKLKEV